MLRLPSSVIIAVIGLTLGVAAWSWPSGDRPDDGRNAASRAAERQPPRQQWNSETVVQPVRISSATEDAGPAAAEQVARTTRQPAHIAAYEETTIYAKAAGFVSSVRVDLGSRVKRGDVLAELWVPEVEQDHARKQALVEEATAAVGQVEAAIHAAEASLAAATARAEEARAQTAHYQAELEFRESEHARFTDLVQRRAVEQALLDEKLKQLHSAKAALAAADAGVASAEADQRVEQARLVEAKTSLAVTAARLKIAQAELKQTEVLMSYAVIRAPYDGVIIERAVDTGDFAQSAVSGKLEPLFTVIRAEPYRIVADVPESDAAWVRPGLPAKLTVNGISDRVFHGDVKRQSEALDSKSRTLRVEVELTDSDDRLRPGMYGFVEIFESSRD